MIKTDMKSNRKPLPPIRICKQCNATYKPNSRHALCTKCRFSNYANWDICACGNTKRKESTSCATCNNIIFSNKGKSIPTSLRKKKLTNKGYYRFSNGVLEHRYMMEQYLDRKLFGGENVHHKNGVKTDNHIDNLELWVTSQPNGQKPKDLVAWAKIILERYEHLQQPSID